MRRPSTIPTLLVATLAGAVCLAVVSLRETERRERVAAENLLSLQAQALARHVDAWNPGYSAHFQRVVASNPHPLRVLLYDLSGWEIGRPRGSTLLLPANLDAIRYAGPPLLRPRLGETPVAPHGTFPDSLSREPRHYNRIFATNILGASWVGVLRDSSGVPWMVATTAVTDFDREAGTAFVSAWLQAGLRLEDVLRPADERRIRLAALALLLGVAAVLGGLGVRSFLREVDAAATALETTSPDGLSRLALPAVRGPQAVRRLLRACATLVERVSGVHAAQQRFVADAAHELRTPLTILRGESQVALRETSDHALLVQTLRSNLDESVRLSRLVEHLLTLARADAGQALVECRPMDPVPVCRECVARLRGMAAEREVVLGFRSVLPEGTRVLADAIALDRILANLLENALRHSPPRQPVELVVSAADGRVRFEVVDRGVGIAPEHLGRLFDRFYRVDASRRRADGGTGLGLALVRALVVAQDARVSVRSEVGQGAVFVVELPVDPGPGGT